MNWKKQVIIGYGVYVVIQLGVFTLGNINSQISKSAIFEYSWILNLILSGCIIMFGTYGYLSTKLSGYNKGVLFILSLLATLIQLFCLFLVSFIVAMFIISRVLHYFGYYVTMP